MDTASFYDIAIGKTYKRDCDTLHDYVDIQLSGLRLIIYLLHARKYN
jgi:hypothetical protein